MELPVFSLLVIEVQYLIIGINKEANSSEDGPLLQILHMLQKLMMFLINLSRTGSLKRVIYIYNRPLMNLARTTCSKSSQRNWITSSFKNKKIKTRNSRSYIDFYSYSTRDLVLCQHLYIPWATNQTSSPFQDFFHIIDVPFNWATSNQI